MDRNAAQAGTALSPLKAFLASASSLEQEPRNTLHPTSPHIPTARGKEEKYAWERSLMAVTAMRGKLGEICEGIQEWKKASTTLQFLVKEVQQLSAKQNARGEDTIQEKDGNEEKPISGTHRNKACADLARQAEEIHLKVSQQITDQTSEISRDVMSMRERLGMVQAELQSVARTNDQLVKYNIEVSKTHNARVSEMAEIVATMRELSQTLEQSVAKGKTAEQLSRQEGKGDSPNPRQAAANKSTTTHQETMTADLLNEFEDDKDVRRVKRKSTFANGDATAEYVRSLSEHLTKAIQDAINVKAEDAMGTDRESLETRLDRLEHKLDMLLSTRETRGSDMDRDAKSTTSQRVLSQQGKGHGMRPYDSSIHPADAMDLLCNTPDRVDAGEEAGNAINVVSAKLVDISERMYQPSAKANEADITAAPQTDNASDASHGDTIEFDANRGIQTQEGERQVHEARTTSCGAKKRMLITFSSSDDEADASVNVNLKRARPTPARGTKSLTPLGNAPDAIVFPPKSSSATAASGKPDIQRRGAAASIPMKAPAVASSAPRRLSVSPDPEL